MSNIQRIFFALFLFLKSIIIPKPAFTNKPESNAPNDKLPSMNNSLSNNEDAQLGIKPIIEANNGDKYLFICMKFAKFSSPTKPMRNPKARLIAKTYPKISNECNNG